MTLLIFEFKGCLKKRKTTNLSSDYKIHHKPINPHFYTFSNKKKKKERNAKVKESSSFNQKLTFII